MALLKVVCPSNLMGEVRGLKAKELDSLGNANRSNVFDDVLKACWTNTEDFGPYDEKTFSWKNALSGDRFYVLLQIFVATHGLKYTFPFQCVNRPACGAKHRYEQNISELAVQKLSDSDAESFKSGNRVHAVLPNGKKYSYKLLTGVEEEKLAKLAKKSNKSLTSSLYVRLHEIEGVDNTALLDYLGEMDLSDVNVMLQEMEQHDCGVETKIDLTCPSCYENMETNLPLDRNYFFPARK